MRAGSTARAEPSRAHRSAPAVRACPVVLVVPGRSGRTRSCRACPVTPGVPCVPGRSGRTGSFRAYRVVPRVPGRSGCTGSFRAYQVVRSDQVRPFLHAIATVLGRSGRPVPRQPGGPVPVRRAGTGPPGRHLRCRPSPPLSAGAAASGGAASVGAASSAAPRSTPRQRSSAADLPYWSVAPAHCSRSTRRPRTRKGPAPATVRGPSTTNAGDQTPKYSSYSNGCGRWASGRISFSRL